MSNVKLVTKEVRLSYLTVFEPKAIAEGSDPKFSLCVLIDKADKATLDAIDKAIKQVVDENKAGVFQNKTKGLKLPLRDGDEERDGEEYENTMFLNASSKLRPHLLDENKQPIMDRAQLYSGCYGRVSLNFYPFNTQGNRGVAVSLNAVMKTRDGDPLGGTYTEDQAVNDFADDDLL